MDSDDRWRKWNRDEWYRWVISLCVALAVAILAARCDVIVKPPPMPPPPNQQGK